MNSGILYGVGVGPGDPNLLTLRAVTVLGAANVVSFFAKSGERGLARTIVDGFLKPGCVEHPLSYPVTTEAPANGDAYRTCMGAFYDAAAEGLGRLLQEGQGVAVLCEGDPFFYGSFMHLWRRLVPRFPCEIIAGITGMAGAWTRAGVPMTWGDDVLTVLPGTLDAVTLEARLANTDAAVVMKLGRNLAKVRAALGRAGRLEEAVYVERGAMANERILPLMEKTDNVAPYFSLILVPGQGRRC